MRLNNCALTLIFIHPLILMIICQGQIFTQACQFNQSISNRDRRCAYTYNYTSETCNVTRLQQGNLTFVSCLYRSLNETSFQMSSSLRNCDIFCKKQAAVEQIGNSYLIITLVAIGIVIVIIITTCVVKRFLCPRFQERQHHMHHTHHLQIMASQRRLRQVNTLPEFQQKWQTVDKDNFVWTEEEQICPICLQKANNIRLGCRHYFHYKCIRQWILQKDQCPTCKSQDIELPIIFCMSCKQKKLMVPQIHYLLLQLNEKCQACQS